MGSALGADLYRRRGCRVGANAYVPKPYGPDELFRAAAEIDDVVTNLLFNALSDQAL